jgi:hypothetical protein
MAKVLKEYGAHSRFDGWLVVDTEIIHPAVIAVEKTGLRALLMSESVDYSTFFSGEENGKEIEYTDIEDAIKFQVEHGETELLTGLAIGDYAVLFESTSWLQELALSYDREKNELWLDDYHWKLINIERRFDRGGPEPFNAYETGLQYPAVVGTSFSSVEPRMITLYPTKEDYEKNPTGNYVNVTQANEFGPIGIPIFDGEFSVRFIADEHFPGGEEIYAVRFTSSEYQSWQED